MSCCAIENNIGIGANYDNTFGDLRVRGSAIYVSADSVHTTNTSDVSAWSVGGIVGFGPFSVGANYTDNGDSAMWNEEDNPGWWSQDSSYWNVAASFETGPMGFSAGSFVGTAEYQGS
jgi:predicted porin